MKQILSTLVLLAALSCSTVPEKTAGIGHYPGRMSESGAPSLVSGKKQYRNLACNRATYQSSSIDYNLTSQLATDGIITEGQAPWLEVLTDGQPVGKNMVEHLFDGRNSTRLELSGQNPSLEVRFHHMPVSADRIEIQGICPDDIYGCRGIEGEISSDGITWKPLHNLSVSVIDMDRRSFTASADLPENMPAEAFRLKFNLKDEVKVQIHTIDFLNEGKLMDVLPSLSFHSAWKSAGNADEWISVDLGADAVFDRMVFHWQNPPVSGHVEISSDGKTWKEWREITDTIISGKGKARYVRAVLDRTEDGEPFELKEWKIFGRGGIAVESRTAPERTGNRQYLTKGGWKVCRSSETVDDGETLSTAGFDDAEWLEATVPGTVLARHSEAKMAR